MSDFSRSLKPWEYHFTEGLYLEGVEAADEAEASAGWVKWTGTYVFSGSEAVNGKPGYGSRLMDLLEMMHYLNIFNFLQTNYLW